MSSLQTVSIKNLDSGRAASTIDTAIRNIEQDVIKRFLVDGWRSVTFTLKIAPGFDPSTNENLPRIAWEVRENIPGEKSMEQVGRVENGEILIITSEPAKPHVQGALFEGEVENAKDPKPSVTELFKQAQGSSPLE